MLLAILIFNFLHFLSSSFLTLNFIYLMSMCGVHCIFSFGRVSEWAKELAYSGSNRMKEKLLTNFIYLKQSEMKENSCYVLLSTIFISIKIKSSPPSSAQLFIQCCRSTEKRIFIFNLHSFGISISRHTNKRWERNSMKRGKKKIDKIFLLYSSSIFRHLFRVHLAFFFLFKRQLWGIDHWIKKVIYLNVI